MANLKGFIITSPFVQAAAPNLSSDLRQPKNGIVWGGAILPTLTGKATMSQYVNTPTVYGANRGDVSQSKKVMTDFYRRFYGLSYRWPPKIEVGLNLQDTVWKMQLWNGNETGNVTITSVSIPADIGVTLNTVIPLTLRPYDGVTLKFTVSGKEGLIKVDDVITVTLSTSQILRSGIAIVRSVVVSLPLDWSEGITERIEYLTNILTAYDETEQRIQLRIVPRVSLVCSYTLSGPDEIGALDSLIWNYQGSIYMIPDWTRAVKFTPITAGDFVLYVEDASELNVVAGDPIVLLQDVINYEVVTVQSVSGNNITLKTAPGASWGLGCTAIPLLQARIPEQLDISRPTGEIAKTSIPFELEVIK